VVSGGEDGKEVRGELKGEVLRLVDLDLGS